MLDQMDQIFGKRQPMLCCYCLRRIQSTSSKPTHCSECHERLPPLYVERYAQVPPFFVQICGWSQHGKTVFLYALTLTLMKMNSVWRNGYAHTPATEGTRAKIREINQGLARGAMPPPTQLGAKDLYMMILEKMERWGGRTLVSRDCAGEVFDTMDVPLEHVPFLISVPVTFMLISLPDLQRPQSTGRTMDELMTNYLQTLLKNKVDFAKARRQVVVVLTKADLIDDLPLNLREYLISDPIAAAVSAHGYHSGIDGRGMAEYVEKMGRASSAIGDWISEEAPGNNFIQLALIHDIDLRFSLISSTGVKLEPGEPLTTAISPRRVLDPYFWALELQSAPQRGIHMIGKKELGPTRRHLDELGGKASSAPHTLSCCNSCFAILDPMDDNSIRKSLVQCPICGACYHLECWQKLDQCPRCKNRIVAPMLVDDVSDSGERHSTFTVGDERIGCHFCFHTFDPSDHEPAMRKLVQCTRCHAYYHVQCWQIIGECCRCQGRSVIPRSVSLPKPLDVVQHMHPLHPLNSEATRASRWAVLIGLVLVALALSICAMFVYFNQR